MDEAEILKAALEDLALVAASEPNERLPKEEQIRCCIYAAIRPLFHVVCVERGYGSVDDGSFTECDLWASSPGQPSVWLEFKRCWSVSGRGWNNKPREQLSSWESDLDKLKAVPAGSVRYFVLVGCFDFDPLSSEDSVGNAVVRNVLEFHASQLVHRASRKFAWRKDDGISWLGAWVWRWNEEALIANERT